MKKFNRNRLAAIFVTAVLLLPQLAAADQFDDQIRDLNNQIKQNQTIINQKQADTDTLKNKLAILGGQISAAQAALDLTKTQIAQTEAQIAKANADMDVQKVLLRDNIRVIYQEGDVTPLEVLASSNSLSDFVSRQEYLSTIKKKIDANIAKITSLKKELDDKNNKLAIQRDQQQAQVNAIASEQTEQNDLLAQTKGEESRYQNLVTDNKKQLQGIYAERARLDALNNVKVSVGGSGGYPYADGPINASDPWGFLTRQCTSYAAWKRRAIGRQPYPLYWGNAGDWVSAAPTTSSPTVGSIAVFPPGVGGAGSIGHVSVVEKVNGNGTMDVSEYNWQPYVYTYRSGAPTAGVRFIN